MAEAGHEIDSGVIERAAVFLTERLNDADPRVRAYMLYSLAVAGKLDETGAAAALALLDEVETSLNPRLLDAYSLAALALALLGCAELHNGRMCSGSCTDDNCRSQRDCGGNEEPNFPRPWLAV